MTCCLISSKNSLTEKARKATTKDDDEEKRPMRKGRGKRLKKITTDFLNSLLSFG
jgi:hypothetical protein